MVAVITVTLHVSNPNKGRACSLFSKHMVLPFSTSTKSRALALLADSIILTIPSGDPGEACPLGSIEVWLWNLIGQISALGREEAQSPPDFSNVLTYTAFQKNTEMACFSGRNHASHSLKHSPPNIPP